MDELIAFLLPIAVVLGVAWFAWIFIRDWRLGATYEKSPYQIGFRGVMDGTLIEHWELGRFVWKNSVISHEKWGNPGNCCALEGYPRTYAQDRTGPATATDIAFVGEIVDIGAFGHKGILMFKIRYLGPVEESGARTRF
jgi:hypothetical protein